MHPLLPLLLLALQAAPLQTIQPVTATAAQSASADAALVNWSETAPPPGALVKVRLRGDPYLRLTGSDTPWRLESEGKELASCLLYSPSNNLALPVELPLTASARPGMGELLLTVDCSAEPASLGWLSITSSDPQLLAAVDVSASLDGLAFSQAAQQQLIYQQLQTGGMLSLTDVHLDPMSDSPRLLQLAFHGDRAPAVGAIQAFPAQPADASFTLPLPLGPMRSLGTGAQHLWPLSLPVSGMRPAALDVDYQPGAALREVRLVELDGQLNVITTLETGVLGDLYYKTCSRMQHTINLDRQALPQTLGLLVSDGKLPPLQVTGVKVNLSEAYLLFKRPPASAVMLVSGKAGTIDALPPPSDGLILPLAGTIEEFSMSLAADSRQQPSASTSRQLTQSLAGWAWLLYLGAAVIATGLAVLLLLPGRRTA